MATDKQQHFNLTATAFLRAMFGALIFEFGFIPGKAPRANDKSKKDPNTPSVEVKEPMNGFGWTGRGTGRTVEALLDAPPILAAHLHQKAIAGKKKGAIPEALKERYRDAWQAFVTPELIESAERMILAAPGKKDRTRMTVTFSLGDVTVSGDYSNRNKDSVIDGILVNAHPDATVSIDGKVIREGKKKAA